VTNTPNWVYFGVFPVDLGALHVVVRAVVVLCRKSGGARTENAVPTSVQSRARPRRAPAPGCRLGTGKRPWQAYNANTMHWIAYAGVDIKRAPPC
jgi:hypothetical protein